MIDADRLAQCPEYYRVIADDVTCPHRVHPDSAFFPQALSAPAVCKCCIDVPSGRLADILSQRKGTAARGVFLKAMMLLGYLYIVFIAEHRCDLADKIEKNIHPHTHISPVYNRDFLRCRLELFPLRTAQPRSPRNQGQLIFQAVIERLVRRFS